MSIWAAIPLASLIAHAGLLVFVLFHSRKRVHAFFAIYLAVAACWSFTSFMLHLNYFPQQAMLWHQILLIAMMWTLLAYYHFIRSYANKSTGSGLYVGYLFLLFFTVLTLTGHVVKSVYVVDGIIFHDLGTSQYIMGAGSLYFISMVIVLLIQRYRSSHDPLDRNRTMYLMAGWGILVVFSYTNLVSALSGFSLDHIGNLMNAVIISVSGCCVGFLRIQMMQELSLCNSMTVFNSEISDVSVFANFLIIERTCQCRWIQVTFRIQRRWKLFDDGSHFLLICIRISLEGQGCWGYFFLQF